MTAALAETAPIGEYGRYGNMLPGDSSRVNKIVNAIRFTKRVFMVCSSSVKSDTNDISGAYLVFRFRLAGCQSPVDINTSFPKQRMSSTPIPGGGV